MLDAGADKQRTIKKKTFRACNSGNAFVIQFNCFEAVGIF